MSKVPEGRFQYSLPTDSTIEKAIEHYSATPALEKLILCCCDRGMLLYHLLLLHPKCRPPETWEKLTGMERRQLNAAVQGFRHCGQQIARINKSQIFRVVREQASQVSKSLSFIYQYESQIPYWLTMLPLILNTYAETLKQCSKVFRPKKAPNLNAAKEGLVKYVWGQTGKPYHEEVSALIGAVLGKPYSVASHLDWLERRGIRTPRPKK